jgi:hypothetical protein
LITQKTFSAIFATSPPTAKMPHTTNSRVFGNAKTARIVRQPTGHGTAGDTSNGLTGSLSLGISGRIGGFPTPLVKAARGGSASRRPARGRAVSNLPSIHPSKSDAHTSGNVGRTSTPAHCSWGSRLPSVINSRLKITYIGYVLFATLAPPCGVAIGYQNVPQFFRLAGLADQH